MERTIEDTVRLMKEDIREKEEQIRLIQDVNWSKPVTEETWHKICQTPLRSSDLLKVLVKNTFPGAENIRINPNSADFSLMGFDIEIPTSFCQGIHISTKWYWKDKIIPNETYKYVTNKLKAYFDAVDRKSSWKELAKLRLNTKGKSDIWLFFAWWVHYKWKAVDRKTFEINCRKEEAEYRAQIHKHLQARAEMHEKARVMVQELIPLLDTFSTFHRTSDSCGCLNPDEIKTLENL